MKLENVTAKSQSASRRRYEDACGTALALDLIGERWALLVVRELMLGGKRFGDLRADLPGISANTLTQRLDGLERHGIVRRRRLPPPAATQVYELTAWGYEAEPIMQVLGRWAVRSPEHDPTRWISAVSILISFRTMIDADRARGLTATIGFRFGDEHFLGRIRDGMIAYERGPFERADVVFDGVPGALAAAIYGGVPFETLDEGGALRVEGDLALARRFATLFVLPPKIDLPSVAVTPRASSGPAKPAPRRRRAS